LSIGLPGLAVPVPTVLVAEQVALHSPAPLVHRAVFHSHALPEADRLAELVALSSGRVFYSLPATDIAETGRAQTAGRPVASPSVSASVHYRTAELGSPASALFAPPEAVLSSAGMAVFHSPAPLVHRAVFHSHALPEAEPPVPGLAVPVPTVLPSAGPDPAGLPVVLPVQPVP